jgi:hypothetical protein
MTFAEAYVEYPLTQLSGFGSSRMIRGRVVSTTEHPPKIILYPLCLCNDEIQPLNPRDSNYLSTLRAGLARASASQDILGT